MKIDTVLVLGIFCIFYVKSVNENLHYPTARVRIFLVKNQRSNAALRIISSAKKSFLFHLSLFTCQAKQDIFPSHFLYKPRISETHTTALQWS
jgi:diadenosine tetraphosphate (Ap4A) HIT family hydrolase